MSKNIGRMRVKLTNKTEILDSVPHQTQHPVADPECLKMRSDG